MRVTRRTLLRSATVAPMLLGAARAQAWHTRARDISEWIFVSPKSYQDPFNEIEMDVIFRDPQGREQRVPAFWAGGQEWRVRYAADAAGRYEFETAASDT